MRDWQKRLEQTKHDNVFETCAYAYSRRIGGGKKEARSAYSPQNGQLVMYTALRRVVLLALELRGNISKRREEKIRDRFNQEILFGRDWRLIRDIILT